MIIVTTATKSKSKKEFQHGVRIGSFLQHDDFPFPLKNCGKIYTQDKINHLAILSVQFSGINYIYHIVQSPSLSLSRTFSSPQTETLCLLSSSTPKPLFLAPGKI